MAEADPLAGGSGGGAAAAVVAAGGAASPAAGASAAAAAAPAPYYADLIGKDGTLNHGSFERLPENLKSLAPTLANIKTTDDLFTKLASLNSLAGRKGLAPLAADAKPEDVAAHQSVLRAVLGVPEKPEGYAFQRPADLPAEAWDDAAAKSFAELLHKNNASPKLAQEMIAFEAARVKGNLAAQEKYTADYFAAQDLEFRDALAKNGQDYDKTMSLVQQVAKEFGMAPENPILKNAQARLFMQKVGLAMGESKFVGGESSGGSLKSDRATAESICHDKTNPEYAIYWDANHPKNGEIKAKVEALFAAAARVEQQVAAGVRR
jgi:hypothetical protein